MVKFSKELEAQLIPEWKDAFVNYWQLKKHVKKVKQSRNPKQAPDPNPDFGRSIFDPIRSLVGRSAGRAAANPDIINKVTRKLTATVEEDGEEEHVYETELVQLFSEEDEVVEFFEMLDDELNKVNKFYKNKETEFMERGELLNKQLLILLDLKRVLVDRRRKRSGAGARYMSPDRSSDFSEWQSESGDTSPASESQSEDVIAALEKNGISFVNSATRGKTKGGKPRMAMRIDIPATTPTRTIAAVTSMLWEDLVNNPKKAPAEYVNRKKIQYAEKMIRGAFVELYRGLGLLKTYSTLNMVAFTKILKKFDKVSKSHVSPSYLRVVKSSHFISSDKVVRVMDEVESLFTKHFANSDRKKAMKFLSPHYNNQDSHFVTFFVGLFTGSFVTLFSVYAILAYVSGLFLSANGNEAAYMETVYPIFSMFALLSLHLFMYGCNLFAWKATRINYNFIFEFQPKTALKYRDAFLICTCLMTYVVGSMVAHLILLCIGFSPHQVDFIPGILLLSSMILLVCPLNIFYRSTRFCFLKVIRNIVFSPLYKVVMVDFFMADQLTSQIPFFRHMESAACYFIAGSFKMHDYETCKSGKLYREFAYIISFAPYYWRAMQCARRWFDEGNVDHLANLGKYASAMVAAGARLTYEREKSSHLCMAIVLVTSVMATVYQLYWDFVKDWGLFHPKSRNPWLRDDLILKSKWLYYASIVLNFVLRILWVETLLRFKVGMFDSRLIEFLLASLEVIRRGHWNFYRLENEHLNNVGKFRAVKTVPLPFRETDSDG
ncbi:phosphate transporter PHO1 isoform X2 [Andrographis paniculata]|uniref:phosphate transporter PHO1 isoform X2 n=1 Tax=Andrographis paniculata TaxID=175694 RepID=UPI0021E794CE|nr:phosphate transporter PHO1 isoform X2 [Andrographis paniculata]